MFQQLLPSFGGIQNQKLQPLDIITLPNKLETSILRKYYRKLLGIKL